MSVWYCIPSARPVEEAQKCVNAWRKMGYKVALWRDQVDGIDCDMLVVSAYPGYAEAVNTLTREVLAMDKQCGWVVTGGDDVYPDQIKRADEIADECETFFAKFPEAFGFPHRHTFGVMQPTGDRWGEDQFGSAYIDRVAASPWMGREFCETAYGGNGPLYHGYTHMFVDEELWNVAKLLGVYWERRDLTHRHEHWARDGKAKMPDFLASANSPEHWRQFKALFENRKAARFPGHEVSVRVA